MKNRKPRADGGYIVNVSFTAKETSLLSFADKNGNFSNYVKQLIKADMEKGSKSDDMLQTLLIELLTEKGLKIVSNDKSKDEMALDKVEQQEKPQGDKAKIMQLMKKNK